MDKETEKKNLAHWNHLMEEGVLADAEAFYVKLRQKHQLTPEICRLMGMWYQNYQLMLEAFKAFQDGLLLDPTDGNLHCDLATTLTAIGSYGLAEQHYRQAMIYLPDDTEILYLLGMLLAALGREEEAADCFCAMLEQEDLDSGEYTSVAVELSRIGLNDQAINLYFIALLEEPDNYYLYSNLGAEFAELGDLESARFCHEKALQLEEDAADLWYNAACCYARMNEPMMALIALEKAIFLDDHNRSFARQDEDFFSLRGLNRFQKLVGMK